MAVLTKNQPVPVSFEAASVSIGRVKTTPKKEITITKSRIYVVVQDPKDATKNIEFTIEIGDIIKCIMHLEEKPVFLFRITQECAEKINQKVHKTEPNGVIDVENYHEKWILMRPKTKFSLMELYNLRHDCLHRADEITSEEIEGVIKKIVKQRMQMKKTDQVVASNNDNNILTYPPSGKGIISLTVEDYECLARDVYLNDKILDFYLKFIYCEKLSVEQQKKTHIFSVFFYNALNIRGPNNGLNRSLNAAQKRHDRVKKWTKDVNIFEKDFIAIPINMDAHWFLVIICFPWLAVCNTTNENTSPLIFKPSTPSTPSTPASSVKRRRTADAVNASGGTGNTSRRSLRSTDPEKSRQKSCILVFDSLGGEHPKSCEKLREYLNCEYQAKIDSSNGSIFNATNMPHQSVKVPQQHNTSDCGLYVLQYVEQFFKDPITDYELPIKNLRDWFETSAVTGKRKEIADLIAEKMISSGFSTDNLPKLKFSRGG